MAQTVQQLHVKIESDFIKQLGQRFAQLENTITGLKDQLESTEKAYDKSLQENLDLTAKLEAIRRAQSNPLADMRIAKHLEQNPEPHVDTSSVLNGVDYEGAYKSIRDAEVKPTLDIGALKGVDMWKSDYGTGKKVWDDTSEDELAPAQPPVPLYLKGMSGIAAEDAKAGATLDRGSADLVTLDDQVRRRKEAQGDRAKMKDTLQRSQNANRKYKARLARQRPQLAALQELANAAFPLYEAVSEALRSGNTDSGQQFLIMPNPYNLQQHCDEFHNKFNEAAETLSHE